ncbi:MAG: HEAT repeat domain-containing protein [Deltaproteobacteria bacterium]|nr:HEAT repeat domain-containing protein [Deltaproteobacteria bacterium]
MNTRITTLGISSALALAGAFAPASSASSPPRLATAEVHQVSASTSSGEGDAARLTDGRLGSAWIAGPGRGEGEELTLRFEATRYLSRLDVHPGYGRDNRSFAEHARPTRLRVSWPGGAQILELADARRTQSFELFPLARTDVLTVTVDAVTGPIEAGVAISEIMAYEPVDVLAVDQGLREEISSLVSNLGDRARSAEASERLVQLGVAAVPWISDLARQADADSGTVALRTLFRIDGGRARDVSLALLRTGAATPSAIVLSALGDGNDARGLESALLHAARELADSEPSLAAAAVDALASTGDTRALPLLARGLASEVPAQVNVAVTRLPAFGAVGREIASRLLQNPSDLTRRAALVTLGGFADDPSAVAAIAPFARDGSHATALAAIRALGRLHNDDARAELARLARAEDTWLVRAAVPALVAHGAGAMPILWQMLAEQDPALQNRIFDELAAARTPEVRTRLIDELLADVQSPWHARAIETLSAHGAQGVDDLLARLQTRPDDASLAASYLRHVAPTAAPSATRLLAQLRPDRSLDELRVVLLETIAQAGYREAVDTVADLYEAVETSERTRRAALDAMGYLPSQRTRDLAVAAMDHPNPQMSILGREAAARLGDPRATLKILAMLQQRQPVDWPVDAVEALGTLQADAALPIFARQFPSCGRGLKLAILRASHAIGGRRAVSILVDGSISPDVAVASLARSLLGRD